jgi:transposase
MNRIMKAVYMREFREEAVKLAQQEGVGVSEAARRLSIPMKSLANWMDAAKAGKLGKVVIRRRCKIRSASRSIDVYEQRSG